MMRTPGEGGGGGINFRAFSDYYITKNMDKNKNMTKQRTRTRLGTMQAQGRDARQEQDKT